MVAPGFVFICTAVAQGVRETEVPSRVQGRSPGRGIGRSPLEAVCRHCLQILTAKTIKVRNCGLIDTLILDQIVSCWGLGDILWGVSPKPMPGAAIGCLQPTKNALKIHRLQRYISKIFLTVSPPRDSG